MRLSGIFSELDISNTALGAIDLLLAANPFEHPAGIGEMANRKYWSFSNADARQKPGLDFTIARGGFFGSTRLYLDGDEPKRSARKSAIGIDWLSQLVEL